jgi:hypothetical protein
MSNEHVPTRELRTRISDLAIAGIPLGLIADIVELDDDTVKKHYRRELTLAEPIAIERVAKTVVMQAIEGNEKCMQMYLKMKGRKFGWVDAQVIENVSDAENQALKLKVKELEEKHEKDY